MLRLAVLGVAVCVQIGLIGSAFAQSQDVIVAGQQTIASLDGNGNGIPGEHDDCNLSATANQTGPNSATLNILGQQDVDEEDKIKPCQGSCNGSGFMSSDFGEAQINDCDYSHAPFVPLVGTFCESLSSCMSDSDSSAHTAGIPNGAVPLRAGAITRVSTGPAGFGQLCTAGGPAVEVTGDNGVTVLRQLFKYPNAQNPTWMCVDNFPVQKGDSPDFVNTTACFPVEGNGTAPIALSGNPDQPFAIIDFQDLLACGRARGAPTVSEWGLMILTTSLLAFGVWTLSRRRAFAAGLPLP